MIEDRSLGAKKLLGIVYGAGKHSILSDSPEERKRFGQVIATFPLALAVALTGP